MTLRIGVLGVGRIGKMHAELVARQVPGASLAMVHDVNAQAAAAVGAELDVPYTTDAEELLASGDVDAVAICSSTDTHVPLMIAAAAAGKAIFCEKPVSLDLAKVDEGLAAVDAAAVPIQIGFNRRFDAAHASVRAAVIDGSVGDVHIVRITSRDPAPPPISYIKVSGGLFLDMMIHDFDMARFVTGSEVVDVYAQAAVRVDPAIGEAGDVDTAVVVLRHENGCITTIDNSRQAVYGYDQRVEAFGSGGMAASENPLTHTGMRRSAAGTISQTIPYFFLDRYIPSYIEEWKAFVAYIADGGPSPVSANDGRAPLVIGLAAWKSYREGRPVRCDEIG
ncbi:MAG: myo-inositol 2-dehydrogenase / D-chiro-inositol 1-dehydrogenase [Ilumatobacteraceae bacterium]|nr:myo-inositol 2-dehydrogenase / D-chiro-inositol 1-dehydrogenase [Ilumatobacteraceae bacterium]